MTAVGATAVCATAVGVTLIKNYQESKQSITYNIIL